MTIFFNAFKYFSNPKLLSSNPQKYNDDFEIINSNSQKNIQINKEDFIILDYLEPYPKVLNNKNDKILPSNVTENDQLKNTEDELFHDVSEDEEELFHDVSEDEEEFFYDFEEDKDNHKKEPTEHVNIIQKDINDVYSDDFTIIDDNSTDCSDYYILPEIKVNIADEQYREYKQCLEFLNIAYAVTSDKYAEKADSLIRPHILCDAHEFEKYQDILVKSAKSKWEILLDSSISTTTNNHAYKAVAFANRETKEVHICTAGTNPAHFNDLKDDVKIIFGYAPSKIDPMKHFVSNVLKLVNEDYTFSTSGHSLGAIVSDLTAAEIISRGLKFNKSTTFDSPGSKTAMEYAIKNEMFSGNNNPDIVEKVAEKAITYNARPNIINITQPQLAKEIYLVSANEVNAIEGHKIPWLNYESKIHREVNKIEQHLLSFFNNAETFTKTVGWSDQSVNSPLITNNADNFIENYKNTEYQLIMHI